MTLRLAALVSGGGRTLLNLADRIEAGTLDAEIVAVIVSRGDCAGRDRAIERGFVVHEATREAFSDDAARDDAIARWIGEAGADLVVLCGWLRRLRVDAALEGRVLNIHPALLPAFGGRGMYGDRVHRAVLDSGARFSGCTVHFVDEEYDHGPIVVQRAVPVRPDDDVPRLAARVFAEECRAYPEAIGMIAAQRAVGEGGRVVIRAAR